MARARWDETVDVLRELADADLRRREHAIPMLVAFRGDELLLCAGLRSHPEGSYHEPIVELLALAVPLGADRLAFSATGRVWSLDDPIPPVVPGAGDLRQRVLIVTLVDGHGYHPPRCDSVLLPVDLAGGEVPVWRERQHLGPGEGWITDTLTLAVARRAELAPMDDLTIGRQALRCIALGHDLGVPDPSCGSPRLLDVLRLAAALEVDRAGEPHAGYRVVERSARA